MIRETFFSLFFQFIYLLLLIIFFWEGGEFENLRVAHESIINDHVFGFLVVG